MKNRFQKIFFPKTPKTKLFEKYNFKKIYNLLVIHKNSIINILVTYIR